MLLGKRKKEPQFSKDVMLPRDILGGCLPQDGKKDRDNILNAASQAFGTERILFAYSSYEGKCWYIAIPSHFAADYTDGWCPLVAALPGNPLFKTKDDIYVYEQDGLVAALVFDDMSGRMQLYAGVKTLIMPQLKSLQKNMITIEANKAPYISWINCGLEKERQNAKAGRMFLMSGLWFMFLIFGAWLFLHIQNYFYTQSIMKDYAVVQKQTDKVLGQWKTFTRQSVMPHLARLSRVKHLIEQQQGQVVLYDYSADDRVFVKARFKKKKITDLNLKFMTVMDTRLFENGDLEVAGWLE